MNSIITHQMPGGREWPWDDTVYKTVPEAEREAIRISNGLAGTFRVRAIRPKRNLLQKRVYRFSPSVVPLPVR